MSAERRVVHLPRLLASFTVLDRSGWLEVPGLELAQAERLLDWLDNHGHQRREVTAGPGGRLTVRFLHRGRA
jgi:hypothetical protein